MPEKLFFKEFGSGLPIVFLHGYPLDHTIWLPLVNGLKSQARLILPDLRGHGKSPAPAGKYTMEAMAEDVLGLMDSLSIRKAVIAGHSMGGYVALAMAEGHPDRLQGLALIASHAYADPADKKKSRLEMVPLVKEQGIQPVLASMPERLSYNKEVVNFCRKIILNANPQGVMGVLEGMAERLDRLDVLSAIKVPTMLIAGADDQIVSLETNRKTAAVMENPVYEEISGAGHMPMLEKPEETALVFRKFIEKILKES
jgi:3-oxoadipate enol-lactonase